MMVCKIIVALIDASIAALILNVMFRESDKGYRYIMAVMAATYLVTMILMFA